MKKLITAALLLFLTFSVFAETDIAFKNGNNLSEECGSEFDFLRGACAGFILGVLDASQGQTWNGQRYCQPTEANARQLMKIVTKYLDEHPAELHLSAYSLVQYSILQAFPCN